MSRALPGLISKARRFASSPQGQRAVRKARDYAESPKGRQKIASVRERFAGRGRGPGGGAPPR